MHFEKNGIFELPFPLDHAGLSHTVNLFAERYPYLKITNIGRSILGNSIPSLVLGNGTKSVLYVGAHHGMEWLTTACLLRFVNECCEAFKSGRTVYKISIPVLLEEYSLHIIPMLNPDGVGYQIHGPSVDHPLYNRVIGMNNGSRDFSNWQANARGVDLNHNYDAGFPEYKKLETEECIPCGAPTRYSGQEPESEPEVRSLCHYIRFLKNPRLILSLHTQGEEIYYRSGGKALPGALAAANKIASLCGYRLADAEGLASYGGLTDWCIQKCGIHAMTLECGKGKNPLPSSDFGSIYAKLREVLFTAPTLY